MIAYIIEFIEQTAADTGSVPLTLKHAYWNVLLVGAQVVLRCAMDSGLCHLMSATSIPSDLSVIGQLVLIVI